MPSGPAGARSGRRVWAGRSTRTFRGRRSARSGCSVEGGGCRAAREPGSCVAGRDRRAGGYTRGRGDAGTGPRSGGCTRPQRRGPAAAVGRAGTGDTPAVSRSAPHCSARRPMTSHGRRRNPARRRAVAPPASERSVSSRRPRVRRLPEAMRPVPPAAAAPGRRPCASTVRPGRQTPCTAGARAVSDTNLPETRA